MKMIMIVFNEAMEEEVLETLQNCRLRNFTRLNDVQGKGTSSGAHFGTDIWPGLNNLLFVAANEDDARQLTHCINQLRREMGSEGIKAFLWNLEEIT